MWPFSALSLESATLLYDVANGVLLLSLVTGVISTFVIVRLGNVKEAFWAKDRREQTERISNLNNDTARLSADAEASRAAIADANARALEAQAQLAQFKAPRTMTEAQARQFIEQASKYSGTQADIWIIGDAPEPIAIGQIIFKLLEISGWKIASWNWSGGGAVIGIAVLVRDASIPPGIDKAATFLVDSLNLSGITSSRINWGMDWDKFPGMLNGPPFSADKVAPIRIVIGTKPQQ